MKDKLIENLVRSLEHQDDYVRKEAVGIIRSGKHTDDRILSKLKTVAESDRNKYIRNAARDAYVSLGGSREEIDQTAAPAPIKNSEGGDSIKCQKCGTETETGNFYQFYYGTPAGEASEAIKEGALVIKDHIVAGPRRVYLCNACIAANNVKFSRSMGIGLLITTIILISVFVVSYLLMTVNIITLISLCLGMIGIPFTYWILKAWWTFSDRRKINDNDAFRLLNIEEVGGSLAVELQSPELMEQGFTQFWEHYEYQRFLDSKPKS